VAIIAPFSNLKLTAVASTAPPNKPITPALTVVAAVFAAVTIVLLAITVFNVFHWSPRFESPLIASLKAIAACTFNNAFSVCSLWSPNKAIPETSPLVAVAAI